MGPVKALHACWHTLMTRDVLYTWYVAGHFGVVSVCFDLGFLYCCGLALWAIILVWNTAEGEYLMKIVCDASLSRTVFYFGHLLLVMNSSLFMPTIQIYSHWCKNALHCIGAINMSHGFNYRCQLNIKMSVYNYCNDYVHNPMLLKNVLGEFPCDQNAMK